MTRWEEAGANYRGPASPKGAPDSNVLHMFLSSLTFGDRAKIPMQLTDFYDLVQGFLPGPPLLMVGRGGGCQLAVSYIVIVWPTREDNWTYSLLYRAACFFTLFFIVPTHALHYTLKYYNSTLKPLKIRPYMFRSPLKPSSGGPWPYFPRLLNWNVDLHLL